MQLILKENVQGLGYKDDVVNVKDGYGRNYLIPTGKAVIASKSALKALEEELKQRAHKLAKIKADAEALAALHIAEALKEQGFEIDRKTIVVKDVKEVGQFVASVKLHKEVAVEVPFTVVAENAPEAEEETPAEVVEEAPVAEEAPAEVVEEAPVAEEEAPAAEEEAPAEA